MFHDPNMRKKLTKKIYPTSHVRKKWKFSNFVGDPPPSPLKLENIQFFIHFQKKSLLCWGLDPKVPSHTTYPGGGSCCELEIDMNLILDHDVS